jgi:protein-S-isoprenylcysteine O-methyltransferase Ste14
MALKKELKKQGLWLFRYRGVLPLIIMPVGALLYFKTKMHPGIFILESPSYETYYELFCLFISLIGFGIRFYTVGYSARNTSGRNTKEQVADTLNTTGLYSIVRHPLYLGNFFVALGPVLLPGNLWFIITFCLIYFIYYERIMFSEEQFLKKKFGNMYTDWAKKVPAFIPGFREFRQPEISFSWKKVIKQEKNGLAAIFLVFCCLDISGELIEKETNYNYVIAVSCILTLLMFAVLKYLQKRTDVLKESGK